MKLGVSTKFSTDQPVKAVEKVAKMEDQITDIEIFCRSRVPEYAVDKLLTLKDVHQLEYYVHAPFLYEGHSTAESELISYYCKQVRKSLQFASKLDSKIVTTHPGLLMRKSLDNSSVEGNSKPTTIVGRRYFEIPPRSFKPLIHLAENNEVTLSLENLSKGNGSKPDFLNSILARYGSLGFTFDVGHAHVSNNLKKFLETLYERIVHVHLHDNNGVEDEHLTVGSGNISYYNIAKQVRSLPVKGILELNSIVDVDTSLRFLHSLGGFRKC